MRRCFVEYFVDYLVDFLVNYLVDYLVNYFTRILNLRDSNTGNDANILCGSSTQTT